MSLRSRIDQIIIEVATKVVNERADQLANRTVDAGDTLGEVLEVDGTQIKIRKADGSEITTTNAGGRFVGPGEKMVLTGNKFAF